jgi:CheY-like chemotaxis protein
MRILVIDDEKKLADTLVMILKAAGHEAEAVYDGADALLRSEALRPECVICDVVMPGMSGLEACAKVQELNPRCHILLFSGQAVTSRLIDDARAKGHAWELLAKPVDPEELLMKLAELKA